MIQRIILTVVLILSVNCMLFSEVISLQSKETLTVLELNTGDRLDFKLSSGRTVSFEGQDFLAAFERFSALHFLAPAVR